MPIRSACGTWLDGLLRESPLPSVPCFWVPLGASHGHSAEPPSRPSGFTGGSDRRNSRKSPETADRSRPATPPPRQQPSFLTLPTTPLSCATSSSLVFCLTYYLIYDLNQ